MLVQLLVARVVVLVAADVGLEVATAVLPIHLYQRELVIIAIYVGTEALQLIFQTPS